MTATVTAVADSVTPVTVSVILSQLSPLSRSFRDPVMVCGVTGCCGVTVVIWFTVTVVTWFTVTVVTWFTVTVVPWCAAGGNTVTGVATTRGDRDSDCDCGDGFRHSSHSHCHLVAVSVILSRLL